jgi:endonuclease G
MLRLLGLAIVGLLAAGSARAQDIREIQYDGFKVWVDCQRRGAVRFFYAAHRDSGSLPRGSSYTIDPDTPRECQSKSTGTFGTKRGIAFDVGHQVPANHFDGSTKAIRQANHWTNLLPQTSSMNKGAWRQTEDIIECLRNQVVLQVWGGAIWEGATNEFVASHGMQTPSAFWKVIIRTDNRQAIGWIVPNKTNMGRSRLNGTIVSVAEIESRTGLHFNAVNKTTKPAASWPIPRPCDIS